jgi:sterol 3beta-glucosyltransferase
MRMSTSGKGRARPRLPNLPPGSDEEAPSSENTQSDDDVEDVPDFEEGTPKAPELDKLPKLSQKSPQIPSKMPERIYMSRSGSMATVRLQRRTKLAQKLREVFDLEGIDEVRAGTCSSASFMCSLSHGFIRNALLAITFCL